MKIRNIIAAASLFAAYACAAAVTVTNVTAVQRYPWNGLVDIDYTVAAGDSADTDIWVFPNGVDADRGKTIPMLTLSGEGAGAPVKPGRHRMTWDAAKDAPGYNTRNFKVAMTAVGGASMYIVVDLSGGPDAAAYPVRASASGPDISSDTCRTTELWLRIIPPGTFMMGSPETELGRSNCEAQHEVTLTRPFYIGVFEVTQKQWQLVTGATPLSYLKGDTRPVEKVSWNDIRGTLNGAMWPSHGQVDADSFLGKLRAKTALTFDLPTEAQWEYACRAGTTTALNSGKNLTGTDNDANMAEVGRYHYNQNDGKGGYASGHTKVGSYAPNTWGLYDMHGNVWEPCLDWWYSNLGTAAVTDPVGSASGSSRIIRGGCYGVTPGASTCRSAYRSSAYSPSSSSTEIGLRLCCPAGLQ